MVNLLVTVAEIVAPHSLVARPVDAGDDVDEFGADLSISGITADAGAALGSPRGVTAIDAGVAW